MKFIACILFSSLFIHQHLLANSCDKALRDTLVSNLQLRQVLIERYARPQEFFHKVLSSMDLTNNKMLPAAYTKRLSLVKNFKFQENLPSKYSIIVPRKIQSIALSFVQAFLNTETEKKVLILYEHSDSLLKGLESLDNLLPKSKIARFDGNVKRISKEHHVIVSTYKSLENLLKKVSSEDLKLVLALEAEFAIAHPILNNELETVSQLAITNTEYYSRHKNVPRYFPQVLMRFSILDAIKEGVIPSFMTGHILSEGEPIDIVEGDLSETTWNLFKNDKERYANLVYAMTEVASSYASTAYLIYDKEGKKRRVFLRDHSSIVNSLNIWHANAQAKIINEYFGEEIAAPFHSEVKDASALLFAFQNRPILDKYSDLDTLIQDIRRDKGFKQSLFRAKRFDENLLRKAFTYKHIKVLCNVNSIPSAFSAEDVFSNFNYYTTSQVTALSRLDQILTPSESLKIPFAIDVIIDTSLSLAEKRGQIFSQNAALKTYAHTEDGYKMKKNLVEKNEGEFLLERENDHKGKLETLGAKEDTEEDSSKLKPSLLELYQAFGVKSEFSELKLEGIYHKTPIVIAPPMQSRTGAEFFSLLKNLHENFPELESFEITNARANKWEKNILSNYFLNKDGDPLSIEIVAENLRKLSLEAPELFDADLLSHSDSKSLIFASKFFIKEFDGRYRLFLRENKIDDFYDVFLWVLKKWPSYNIRKGIPLREFLARRIYQKSYETLTGENLEVNPEHLDSIMQVAVLPEGLDNALNSEDYDLEYVSKVKKIFHQIEKEILQKFFFSKDGLKVLSATEHVNTLASYQDSHPFMFENTVFFNRLKNDKFPFLFPFFLKEIQGIGPVLHVVNNSDFVLETLELLDLPLDYFLGNLRLDGISYKKGIAPLLVGTHTSLLQQFYLMEEVIISAIFEGKDSSYYGRKSYGELTTILSRIKEKFPDFFSSLRPDLQTQFVFFVQKDASKLGLYVNPILYDSALVPLGRIIDLVHFLIEEELDHNPKLQTHARQNINEEFLEKLKEVSFIAYHEDGSTRTFSALETGITSRKYMEERRKVKVLSLD